MKKPIMKSKLKGKRKLDKTALMEKEEGATMIEEYIKRQIKKQFDQDNQLFQRIKCPVVAMACCLMLQV